MFINITSKKAKNAYKIRVFEFSIFFSFLSPTPGGENPRLAKTVGATHTRQICDLHRSSGALPQTPLHRLQKAGAGTVVPAPLVSVRLLSCQGSLLILTGFAGSGTAIHLDIRYSLY